MTGAGSNPSTLHPLTMFSFLLSFFLSFLFYKTGPVWLRLTLACYVGWL